MLPAPLLYVAARGSPRVVLLLTPCHVAAAIEAVLGLTWARVTAETSAAQGILERVTKVRIVFFAIGEQIKRAFAGRLHH